MEDRGTELSELLGSDSRGFTGKEFTLKLPHSPTLSPPFYFSFYWLRKETIIMILVEGHREWGYKHRGLSLEKVLSLTHCRVLRKTVAGSRWASGTLRWVGRGVSHEPLTEGQPTECRKLAISQEDLSSGYKSGLQTQKKLKPHNNIQLSEGTWIPPQSPKVIWGSLFGLYPYKSVLASVCITGLENNSILYKYEI